MVISWRLIFFQIYLDEFDGYPGNIDNPASSPAIGDLPTPTDYGNPHDWLMTGYCNKSVKICQVDLDVHPT